MVARQYIANAARSKTFTASSLNTTNLNCSLNSLFVYNPSSDGRKEPSFEAFHPASVACQSIHPCAFVGYGPVRR